MIALPPTGLHARGSMAVRPADESLNDTKLMDAVDASAESEMRRFATLGRLVPGIAHDVNNLLAVICGYAELLAEQLDSDDPRRELTGLIGDLGRRAGEMLVYVDGLGSAPAVATARLPELFAKLGRILRCYVGAEIAFSADCAPDLGSIPVDPIEALQVVLNLVGNARDATPDGGAIAVRAVARTLAESRPGWPQTVPPGRFAVLTVSDTGCGIDDDTLRRIFESDFATRAERGGTGTGLATVARIVDRAGGRIQVETELDWGTRVRVFFPMG